MAKTLRIPNEPRFVRAFALTVDPGDTLSLLMEIGALSSRDLGIVRQTREALDTAYDWAGDVQDWEQTHTIGVLRQALAEPDSAAYLAYAVQDKSHLAAEFVEALAVVGCANDTMTITRRRPWEVETDDLYLADWRKYVWKLLFAMPGNALPKPSRPEPPTPPAPLCICSEPDSPAALAGDHPDWCPAGGEG